ncbi:unnamed protein product [Urochloa humidicola]
MLMAWRLNRLKPVRKLEGNRFIIEFEAEEDYNYVINGGPWRHKGDALIVVPYDGFSRPSEVLIDSVNMWIIFYDVPVTLMTEAFTVVLAKKVSKVVLEVGEPGGDYLRARVAFPLEEAIKPVVEVRIKGKGTMSFDVRYENAPFFCFNCGRMGHSKECPEEEDEEDDEHVTEEQEMGRSRKRFGEWLRKTPPKKGEGRQIIIPAAPSRANRALNFSGGQLAKIQAASSAMSGSGGGRKGRPEVHGKTLLLGYRPYSSLPKEVSSALSASLHKMAVNGAGGRVDTEASAGCGGSQLNRISGLDSYAGSSENQEVGNTMNTSLTRTAEYMTVHERLQAAKAAKANTAGEKKNLKGPGPIKEIGKARRGKKVLKAEIVGQIQQLKDHGLEVDSLVMQHGAAKSTKEKLGIEEGGGRSGGSSE